jgi:hypothetical protein
MTTISNKSKYKSRYVLYEKFRRYIVEELKTNLLTVELAYDDEKFVVTNRFCNQNEIFVQLRGKAALWHKENLLNIGLKHLPADCEYLAAIDADVKFERPDIVEATIEALQIYNVVQMFGCYVSWGPEGKSIEKEDESLGKKFIMNTMFKTPNRIHDVGHPGFSWAFRRRLICDLQFPDFAVLGSGDTIQSLSLVSKVCYLINERTGGRKLPEPYLLAMLEYETAAERIFQRKLGYVKGKILHSFHGLIANRQYVDRKNILIDGKFDPEKDLEYDQNGVVKWSDQADKTMIQKVAEYFVSRKEDDLPSFSANGNEKSTIYDFNEETYVYSLLEK